jgi:hypothetical protein
MTANEPVWCTPEELKRLPRLVVWKCHHCNAIGFSNQVVDSKCRKCWHVYYLIDMLEDSHCISGKDSVRFTKAIVPEWRPDAPWVFAWFPQKCQVQGCGETYWVPVDKLDVLKWEIDHVCKRLRSVSDVLKEIQFEIMVAKQHILDAERKLAGMGLLK